MLSIEEIKDIVATALFNKDIIDKEFYLKCSKSKYIQSLPGDLRSNDVNVLEERIYAIEDELSRREEIIKNANYRIGVKVRDNARLNKRVTKHQEKMDKSIDNINKESDKIVKDIDKLESKLNKLDLSEPNQQDLKSTIQSRLDSFKKSHNKFFDMDLNPNNVKSFRAELDTFKANGVRLHNILVDLNNGGLITKADMNKGDISKNISRIEKSIDNFVKSSESMGKDNQKMEDNTVDIDYIYRESQTVLKEADILNDEYDATLRKYLDNGGDRSIKPGVNQEGWGTRLPELADEMEKLLKDTYK